MPPLILALIIVLLVGLAVLVGWRLASRRYTLPCPSWLGWMLEGPFGEAGRIRTTLERLELQPGMKVLDVGCGPGRLVVPLARQLGAAGEVTALDIQPAMLRRAQARTEAAGLHNVRFVLAGIGQAHLEKDSFDRALLVTVLGEIPDRQAALRVIFDALQPGGFLSVTELVLDPHFQSRATIEHLSRAAGFRPGMCYGNRFFFTLNLEKPARAA